jgi:hypothetical protein
VLIAGLALGGCSSPNRAAGQLGTRVCIVNESTTAANVVFTKRDTARGEGSVAPGNQACGEGTSYKWTANDVEANITLPTPYIEMKMTLEALNPAVGSPELDLHILGSSNEMWCVGVGNKSQGEKVVWDDGVLRYTLQRLADGQWKEFTVTLAETEKPSASGFPEGKYEPAWTAACNI